MTASLASADIVILIVILLSALIGLVRGLIKEVFALGIWLAAFLLGLYFASVLAQYLPVSLGDVSIRTVIAFVVVFVGTLIAGGILQWAIGKLVQTSGLSGTDRLLGFTFGGLRGVLVAIIALIVLRPFAEHSSWWLDSAIVPELLAFEADVLHVMGRAKDAVVELSKQTF